MSTVTFPRRIDGRLMGCPELIRATGLSRWDILKAFEGDPEIATLAALKAAVVKRKSRPARHPHGPNRASLHWNGMDCHRKPLNKP